MQATTYQRSYFTFDWLGVISLACGIVVLGLNWPAMKAGLNYMPPLWFSALRFATGAACLFAIQLASKTLRPPTRQDLPVVASVGLVQMMLFTALGSIAMLSVDAGRSAILGYTTPLWVVPIAVLVFKEKLSKPRLVGTLLGMLGVLVIFNPLETDWANWLERRGNGLLLICSVCWALTLLHQRYCPAASSAYRLAPWQMLLAALPLMGLAYWFEGPFPYHVDRDFWRIMLFVGPVATAFCYVAINSASGRLPSSVMSTAMLGVPMIGLLSSVVLLGESLTSSLMVGIASILLGIFTISAKSAS